MHGSIFALIYSCVLLFTDLQPGCVIVVINGKCQVVIKNGNGCESDTSLSLNYVAAGIFEKSSKNLLSIFPNPTTGILTIDMSSYVNDDFVVSVYNALGELMLRESNAKKIDLSYLENGIYNLSLRKENNAVLNKKVILIK